MDDVPQTPAKRGRFIRLRRVPVPTWRVVLPLFLVAAATVWFGFPHLMGWLCLRNPDPSARLVAVEGWLPDYALRKATAFASARETDRIYCTGGPVDRGTIIDSYDNYANYASAAITRLGISGEKVVSVPSAAVGTARTRSMAAALRRTLDAEAIPMESRRINLLTLGTHARRSHTIYQEELGPSWHVGVISLRDEEVDPDRWYLESHSMKAVITELIAITLGLFGGN